jgi:DNA-binding MarR family transcriptional regulator
MSSAGADLVGRLYLALGRVNRALRREAQAAPVGHGALSVLATLTKEGPQRLGTLATAEGVSPPSMTRIITSLEGLGHVRRTPDPQDRRASVVEATASGQRVVQAGRDSRVAALRDRVDALSPTDRDLLCRAVPVLEALGAL